jgi:hypothetical protein
MPLVSSSRTSTSPISDRRRTTTGAPRASSDAQPAAMRRTAARGTRFRSGLSCGLAGGADGGAGGAELLLGPSGRFGDGAASVMLG